MAYDEDLADRLRVLVQGPGVSEQRMFGGHAFLVHGNLAVAASSRGGLMVRVDPARTEALLTEPSVRRVEMRGRQLAGWLRVGPETVASEEALQRWAALGVAYARSLPPKR